MDNRKKAASSIRLTKKTHDGLPLNLSQLNTAYEEVLSLNNELALQIFEKDRQNAELLQALKLLKKSERDTKQLNTKLAHKVILRTTQYAFISHINQSIVHSSDQETLFWKSCKIACEIGKFSMAWIGIFDTENRKINIVEQSGLPKEDVSLFNHVSFKNNGAQQHVLDTGNYYLCNDIAIYPNIKKWESFILNNNIRSFIAIPIKRMGIVIGTFNLYASDLNFFDKEVIAPLMEVAGDISFALELFEKERKHRATEELIIKNEQRFRALVENGTDAVAILSSFGQVKYISPSIYNLLGYTEEEAMKFDLLTLMHPDDAPAMSRIWETVLKTKGVPVNGHTGRMRHKDGTWRWLEAMVTNMLHEPSINGIIDNFRDVTQRIESERQREFDKNNLNALINTTEDLMWSVDKNLRLITYNQPFFNAMKMLYGKELMEGEHVFWHEHNSEETSRFRVFYDRAFAGETFTEIEYTEAPTESWSQISYYPIRIGKEVIGSACYSRDITKLKKAEVLLKKSEAFNRGVLNSLSSHIAVVDKNGFIIAVNDAWKRFGEANSGNKMTLSGVGTNYFDECERAAASGVQQALEVVLGMKDVIEGRRPDHYVEYECHSPTKERWFGMRVMKFDSDEQLLVVAHNCITERKFAEVNLLDSQAKLKEAQALAHMGSWQLNFKTNLLQLSDESCRIFEISIEESQLSFVAWSKLVHPEDRPFVLKMIKDSRDTLTDISYHYRIKSTNGLVRHIYSESKFVFDSENKAIALYGIMQDITERKMDEEEREKITADILRRNKDLEQFSYIVSHNLRAPVANIIGLAEVVRDEDLDPITKSEVMEGISESVTKLDEVITDLNYILQSKQDVSQKREMVNFSKLTDAITSSIDKLIVKEKGIVVCDFNEVAKMFTVKSYLHSIFYNLINNSLKYRRADVAPYIEIKSHKQKNKVVLTFTDNGIGIDLKNNGEQVFGMYKRFHPEISEGKGMGLYMVKTQVESIGGKIYIESKVNQGTTFTIEFNTL